MVSDPFIRPSTDHADSAFSTYAILAHELTHAWVTAYGYPEKGANYKIAQYDKDRSNQETFAVREQNRIFGEMAKHMGNRTTYAKDPVVDPTKSIFNPCKCKQDKWYGSLPWGGPAS